MWIRRAILAAGIVIASAFAVLVWPTAYRYQMVRLSRYVYGVRVNRFTGHVQFLGPSGWRAAGPSEGRPSCYSPDNPFAADSLKC